MPSLREMAEQKKAQTAAEAAKQEKEAKTETTKAAKAQLGEIGSRLQKMEALKQQLPSTKGELQAAKESFKEKRKVIKEVTGELEDINVRELVRNPDSEFDEVMEYQQAFSTYKEKQDEAGDIRKLIEAEFGVSYAELKPGQVEILIEERQKELHTEQEALVRENPEADPELYKEIRERLVTGKTKRLFADGTPTDMQRSFYDEFYNKDEIRNGRGERERPLKKDVDIDRAVEIALANLDKSNDKKLFLNQLDKTYKNEADTDAEIDIEALKRAIAQQLVSGSDAHYGFQSEVSEVVAGTEKVDDDGRDSMDAYYKNKTLAAERVAQAPALQKAAEKLMGEYKEYAEYKALPKQIEDVDKRISAINDRISNEEQQMPEGRRARGMQGKLDALAHAEYSYTYKIQDAEKKMVPLGKFDSLRNDINGLPSNAREVGVSVSARSEKIEVRIQASEMYSLSREVEGLGEKEKGLEQTQRRWQETKNGLFGPSDEKKKALARVEEELPGVKEELTTKRAQLRALEEAQARASEVARRIESSLTDLGPDNSLQYTGPLSGLADHLEVKKVELQERFTRIRTQAQEQKQDTYNQRLGISTEIAGLQEEKSNLSREKEILTNRQKELAPKYQPLTTSRY